MIASFESELPCSADSAFSYHETPGALTRLIPAWERVRFLKADDSIRPGAKVLMQVPVAGIWREWLASHELYEPPNLFSDRQVRGPFSRWHHMHRFRPIDADRCLMEDTIEYELPGGRLGSLFGGKFVESKLRRLFSFRHRITQDDLRFKANLIGIEGDSTTHRTFAISGASGMVGSEVVRLLNCLGHKVIRLHRKAGTLRRDERGGDCSIVWDPEKGLESTEALEGIDAVIHLAGKNIGNERWSESVKRELWSSRVDATAVLASQLASMSRPPRCLVTASAIGYYGDRGDQSCDEYSSPGTDYLSRMADAWEKAARPTNACGLRTVAARLGVVLSLRGGVLPKMNWLFRFGMGGRLGSGHQFWSWIVLEDAAAALVWLALNPDCEGPYNVVAGACRNSEFTEALGCVVRRPTLLPVPKAALRLALGETADRLVLSSTRASPQRLQDAGYQFRFADLKNGLRFSVGAMTTTC